MNLPRIAMVTNIPAPYREDTHILLNEKYGLNYRVFYCAMTEPNRLWKIKEANYSKIFLKRNEVTLLGKSIYINIDIIKQLIKFNPDVVITAGFSPTMLLAFLWTKIKAKKHLTFTDATIQSEGNLSFAHRWVRRAVFFYTSAFIGASKKSLDLYTKYKADRQKLFLSPLCIDNDFYRKGMNLPKKYDLVFSGQFISRKMPFFFVEVVKIVNQHLPCKILLMGSGKLKDQVLRRLQEARIDYTYAGFVQQNDLPLYYGSAKVLFFSTNSDPWGIVANEACAVGLPVVTTEHAGVAHELVIHEKNGYVLPVETNAWAEAILKLLTDTALYRRLSKKAIEQVQYYCQENAVRGIVAAVDSALGIVEVKETKTSKEHR